MPKATPPTPEADEPSVSREEERARARPVVMEPLAASEYPDGPPAEPLDCAPDPGLDFPETGNGKNADARLPEKFVRKGKLLRPWDQTTLFD